MTTFKGVGAGQRGGWTRRSYNLSTGEVRDNAPPKARTSSTRSGKGQRFQPFVSRQLHANDAKALGLKHDKKKKATYFETERQLNNHLARERDHGREVGWKD